MQPAQLSPAQIEALLRQSTGLTCQAETEDGICDSQFFIQTQIVRKVSKLLVPGSPQDIILPIPVLVCSECGEILLESIPPILQDKFSDNGQDNLRIIN